MLEAKTQLGIDSKEEKRREEKRRGGEGGEGREKSKRGQHVQETLLKQFAVKESRKMGWSLEGSRSGEVRYLCSCFVLY